MAVVNERPPVERPRAEVLHQLEANGLCVLNRYLDAGSVENLTSALAESESDGDEEAGRHSPFRQKRGVRFARRNLLSCDFIRRIIASDPVVDLVKYIDPAAVAVRAILFDKTGDANWTVPWHQDRSIAVARQIEAPGFGPWSQKAGVIHVQPPLEILTAMFTLRLSLDDCGPANGPLRTIAGTHRSILDSAAVEKFAREQPESICATEAGGVVIMRPLILHASSPARIAHGHRRVLHIEFGPAELPGGLVWAMV
ncbi:MAG TPA: phytanoyl-CoA dioxygenase family protein [Tepidisphaeraceae bacterium]|nr:phytanoyl-CoA dioxygenase family protein [Tepidisphaeraceae bacterium]